MSIEELSHLLLRKIQEGSPAIIANIPNLDQVGHTGSIDLARQAASYVDQTLEQIYDTCQQSGRNLVITADHGNADQMRDVNGSPYSSHSFNPVPLIVINENQDPFPFKSKQGTLADVASVFLTTLGFSVPKYMDSNLININ